MPVVRVEIGKGRTAAQKKALMKGVTDAVTSSLEIPPEWVTVLIYELERSDIATGGVPLDEQD